MPLYKFECADCSHKFEELVLSSNERPDCPECKSDKVDKQLSLVATPVVNSGAAPCGAPSPGKCNSGFG